jgi:hypothetical protein
MLDHEKHVEACALLQRIIDDVGPLIPYRAAVEAWLEENHPEPAAYMAAMRSLAGKPGVPA